ncbi:murein hydrolase activator EnvC family protein [Hippea jasoniae]|uniref:murein hydrolase activator EnvC family protein n=1 Tax=Hippea jasoniae TaxID=944479 RepID=UPI0005586B49|nr:peptidoglycan DD-metalloendopeptidase family protein [Hippea jasoniae]
MKKFSIALLILLIAFPSFAFKKISIQKKLQNINAELNRKKVDYEKIRNRYASILNQIKSTDRRISYLKKKIETMQKDLILLNRRISKLKKEIATVSVDLNQKKEQLFDELKEYYMYSKVGPYYSKGVWYGYMNGYVTDYMQKRINNYIDKREYLKKRIVALNSLLKKKQNLIAGIKTQQNNLNLQKQALALLAKKAEKQKQLYLAQIKELTKKQQNLKALLKRIIEEEKKRKQKAIAGKKINKALIEREFSLLRSKIKPPVEGRVISRFGRKYDPLFKVYTRNDGIDIKSKQHSCVRVIAYGRVDFVGVLPGYGGVVIVNHLNGYYTVYGGLNPIVKKGEVVRRYSCIGRLSKNVLHFEIRRHSQPIDPLTFLDRRFLR